MHPPEKKAPEPLTLVVPIIRAGLQHEQLRDEIYCQLIKQTFVVQFQKPPPREITTRGWELLAFIAGAFLPSEELAKYVAAYVLGSQNVDHKPIVSLARSSQRRLERAWLRYSFRGIYRTYAPSLAELAAGEEPRPRRRQRLPGGRHVLLLLLPSPLTPPEASPSTTSNSTRRPARTSASPCWPSGWACRTRPSSPSTRPTRRTCPAAAAAPSSARCSWRRSWRTSWPRRR